MNTIKSLFLDSLTKVFLPSELAHIKKSSAQLEDYNAMVENFKQRIANN